MKTPKRIAYCSCGCWLNLESASFYQNGKIQNAATLFCPKCGADYRGEAFAARIIRKNRENRLKHALRRKDNANRSLAEKLVRAYKLEQAYDSFIDKMLESYFEIGTYGQDVEGS